jgi:hypothetical protein
VEPVFLYICTRGSWARNNEQKALRFSEHLENIFQPNTAENNEVLSDVVLQDSV